MGAPKIKLYQLPNGYSEDSDSDVQQTSDDELIPIQDKPIVPEDFYELTGITEVSGESLHAINFSFGEVTGALVDDSQEYQNSEYGHTDILAANKTGAYSPVVKNSSLEVISVDEYECTPSGVRFLNEPYPSGATISYWRTGSSPGTHWVSEHYPWYDGTNKMFEHVVYDDGDEIVSENDYTLLAASGCVNFNSAKTDPTADYTYETTTTKYFIGRRENWLPPNEDGLSGGHLYLGPDIFKGMYDYPGDDTEDELGNPIVQGEMPKYAESSEYQINFRKGMVTFSSEVDSDSEPVHASFAHMVGVRNVTEQELDQVASASGNYRYKAVNDKRFPESIGTRWINRDDHVTPRNIYVDGSLKPQIVTVTPYDTLDIKQ